MSYAGNLVGGIRLCDLPWGTGCVHWRRYKNIPFASRRTLPPIFYCTEAFAFVGAGAGVIGVVFFYTLFSMPLPWLTGNLPRLWPLLPTDAAGILIGFLIARHKLAKAK